MAGTLSLRTMCPGSMRVQRSARCRASKRTTAEAIGRRARRGVVEIGVDETSQSKRLITGYSPNRVACAGTSGVCKSPS